jgi:hypothetical protein
VTHPGPCKGAGCNFCELFRASDFHNRLWGGPGVSAQPTRTAPPRVTLPCVHVGNSRPDPTGAGRSYYDCEAGKGTVCRCECGPKCDRYAADVPDVIPAGVVIGHYGMPAIVAVQVRLIREHCGPVPVLVHDDWSPEPERIELDRVCGELGVEVVRSGRENIGHAGGDLGAFFRGLTWAQTRGLRVLVKLSQRFLIDTPNWLADAADLLTRSRESCLTDACIEGASRLPLRTESIALDVARWSADEPMRVLRPRRVYPLAAEYVVHQALARVGGGFRVWPLLGGPHRQTRTPGVLWHCNTSPDEYRQLAARFGLTLPDNFFTHGWPKAKREDWG